MVNIQYFVDKMKVGRDAAVGPSAGENPTGASNGEEETRPGESHSISEFANVVNTGCGVKFNLGGPKFELLASAEESAYWVMKGTLPADVSVPLHSHGDEESFYLISGEAQFLAPTPRGLQWKTLRQGDFVHIPSDAKHAWRNLSTDTVEVLLVTTPPCRRARPTQSCPPPRTDRGKSCCRAIRTAACTFSGVSQSAKTAGWWSTAPFQICRTPA